ncbi:MAG: FAD-dependent monooxygenase, partial [Planctomycetales bacterium]|nr:FAD-dependent monooxygenase [Planctomycetales bacterium]
MAKLQALDGFDDEVQVLVVGAGPVGLTLACELLRHGVKCRVLDAGNGPTPVAESRALGIQARSLEVFDDVGISGELTSRGHPLTSIDLYAGQRRLTRFDFAFDGLGTCYPYLLILSQGETERVLVERLRALGGCVEWNCRLQELRQDEHRVTAVVQSNDGATHECPASYLVGCDGAHSQVRHCLSLAFEGAAYEELFLLADVEIDWPLSPKQAHILITADGLAPAIPLADGKGWRLIDATGVSDAREEEQILERFRRLLAESPFPQATIRRVIWTSAFRIHRRVVDRMHVGRCFVAGDAAHLHSPVGGQGMNTGIQDAYNLAWKLAHVVYGFADERLLKSYDDERLPVAKAVIRNTDRATRMVTLRSRPLRALRNLVASNIAGWVPLRRRITRGISQLGIAYRRGALAYEAGEGHRANGVRPGARLPNVALSANASGARLYEYLSIVRYTLLILPVDDSGVQSAGGLVTAVRERLRDLIECCVVVSVGSSAEFGNDIDVIRDDKAVRVLAGRRNRCLLVRPDKHVALGVNEIAVEPMIGFLRENG